MPGGYTGQSVIGRTDIDGVGIAGLELQYNDLLQGSPGRETLEVAPGRPLDRRQRADVVAPQPGVDIVTTIDRSVQYSAEQALLRRVNETGAKGGQLVVMSVDGEILAMASVDQHDGVGGSHVRQLLGRRRLRAGLGGQDHHRLGRARTSGAVTPRTVLHGAVAEACTNTPATGHAPRLHYQHDDDDGRRADPRRVVEHRDDHDLRDDGLRTQYHYMRAFGLGQRTALHFPGENPGHPQAVADVGGHREVHGRLRAGRREQPDPAHLGRQHDRQRRCLHGARSWCQAPSTPTARSARRRAGSHQVVSAGAAPRCSR